MTSTAMQQEPLHPPADARAADAVRALMVSRDAATPVLATLAWTTGLLAVLTPAAAARYRTRH